MTADVDTTELGQPRAEEAEEALRSAQHAARSGPPPPDRFSFHLSLPDSASEDPVAVVGERDVPPGLRPLLALAAGRATPREEER